MLFDATDMTSEKMLCLTPAAAVAVVRVAKTLGVSDARIKWVNDILVGGKKACGILCESTLSPHGTLEYIIVGIGINISTPDRDFPEEIRNIATSVFGADTPDEDIVCRLCADILSMLTDYCDTLSERPFLDEYRSRLFVLGKEISVLTPTEAYHATATDIDRDAHLIVTLPDGEKRILSAGEISIRATFQS